MGMANLGATGAKKKLKDSAIGLVGLNKCEK